jgi:hypothetical protein
LLIRFQWSISGCVSSSDEGPSCGQSVVAGSACPPRRHAAVQYWPRFGSGPSCWPRQHRNRGLDSVWLTFSSGNRLKAAAGVGNVLKVVYWRQNDVVEAVLEAAAVLSSVWNVCPPADYRRSP